MIIDYLIWIGLILLIITGIVVIIVALRQNKRNYEEIQRTSTSNSGVVISNTSITRSGTNDVNVHEVQPLVIKYKPLENLSTKAVKRLVPITDKQLLNQINSVIPGTMQAVINSVAAQNYGKSVQAAGTLYSAIIPNGETLSKSLSMDGAVRGFTSGNKGIQHHANFIAVENNAGDGLLAVNTINSIMNVASLVVGQYYMSQVNRRLNQISEKLGHIETIVEAEFKGKVQALLIEVQRCAIFQCELLQKDDVRNRELLHLKNLEHDCAELLGQANAALQEVSGSPEWSYSNYEYYESAVEFVSFWVDCQQILLEILGKIGDLTYTMNLGTVSREYAYALYEPYAKQTEAAIDQLYSWHRARLNQFGVNTVQFTRKRAGLDKVMMSLPSVFNEDLKYRSISENTARMIDHQMSISGKIVSEAKTDLFHDEVQLIAKDGKLYYLPSAS